MAKNKWNMLSSFVTNGKNHIVYPYRDTSHLDKQMKSTRKQQISFSTYECSSSLEYSRRVRRLLIISIFLFFSLSLALHLSIHCTGGFTVSRIVILKKALDETVNSVIRFTLGQTWPCFKRRHGVVVDSIAKSWTLQTLSWQHTWSRGSYFGPMSFLFQEKSIPRRLKVCTEAESLDTDANTQELDSGPLAYHHDSELPRYGSWKYRNFSRVSAAERASKVTVAKQQTSGAGE